MTLDVYNKLGRVTTGAVSTLRALLALPRKTFSPAGAAIEMSIRDWGRREKLAHDALKEVDEIRLRSLEQSFQTLGFAQREARVRGYIAYAIMMGDSILKEALREEIATEEFVELAVAVARTAAIAFESVAEPGRPEKASSSAEETEFNESLAPASSVRGWNSPKSKASAIREPGLSDWIVRFVAKFDFSGAGASAPLPPLPPGKIPTASEDIFAVEQEDC